MFVSAFESMSNAQEVVRHRFVSEFAKTETLAPRCRLSLDEYRHGMSQALKSTGQFEEEEIRDIDNELLAGLQHKSALSLISAPQSHLLLAKQLGWCGK